MGVDIVKLLTALKGMDMVLPFSDLIYNVRERESKGWEGPKVKAWSHGCDVIDEMFRKYAGKYPNGLDEVMSHSPWAGHMKFSSDTSGTTVHILFYGKTLCGFGEGQFPGQWPSDHRWTYAHDLEHVTCEQCRAKASKTD